MTLPPRDVGSHLAQPLGNIFIGKPVEAVAPYSVLVEGMRESVAVCVLGTPPVKGCVEAGNLRHIGVDVHGKADRREIVRLMERREVLVARQPLEHRRIDQHGANVVRTAMHHPVSDRPQFDAVDAGEPVPRFRNGSREVANGRRIESTIHEVRAVGVARLQVRVRAYAVDLPADLPLQPAPGDTEDLELQTGRAGIDDENRFHITQPLVLPAAGPQRAKRLHMRRGACGPNPPGR